MLNPWILKKMVNEHHNDLLEEAETYRMARQAAKERRSLRSPSGNWDEKSGRSAIAGFRKIARVGQH